ncbi:MAG: hypothetical protein K0R54_2308 [Clostridiaceae bacterium]|jgi:hypothetical protein|nr:hypothetical protein [Clostridiaceae bacterium]
MGQLEVLIHKHENDIIKSQKQIFVRGDSKWIGFQGHWRFY